MTAPIERPRPWQDAAVTLAGLVNSADSSEAVQALLENALQQAYVEGYDERDQEGCECLPLPEDAPRADEQQSLLVAIEELHRRHDAKFPARLCRACSPLVATIDRIPTWS